MALVPQIDLLLDGLMGAPLKDDRALMEFPFFSLTKRPQTAARVYSDGRVQVRVTPGPNGMATQWDKDVLIYCVSILNDRIERGLPTEPTIRFHASDFLRSTGRGVGKQGYDLFLDALFRLRSTTIETTIPAAGSTERRGFGWIAGWRVVERDAPNGTRVMAAIEVTLNDWMYRAVVQERRVLTINESYFTLGGALERRLYELARKHCGRQESWSISLPKLCEKVGTSRPLKALRLELAELAEGNALPDYRMSLEVPALGRDALQRTIVLFEPRPLKS
ncbi:MAG: replication initiator protein A [Roseomonas mucosa]|nr:replication initiator protein A [Roseomonas mucosa]